jgi:hypothetical protein
MGFGLKLKLPKFGSKKWLTTVAYAGIGGPGLGAASLNEEGKNIETGILKGVGNLVTGGYLANKEATAEAKKARDIATQQYEEQQAAVEAETKRLADLDEEKKRKLAQAGTQNPQTLLGGYKGVQGGANLYKSLLGA